MSDANFLVIMENKAKVKKPKRMTAENKRSFMHNMKCSFKSCHNIADYTTQFDDISALPIITNAMIKICIYHKEEILKSGHHMDLLHLLKNSEMYQLYV
jgi:hypothetical protein